MVCTQKSDNQQRQHAFIKHKNKTPCEWQLCGVSMSVCVSLVCMVSLVMLHWHTDTQYSYKYINQKGIEFLLSSKTRWIHNSSSSSNSRPDPKPSWSIWLLKHWHRTVYILWIDFNAMWRRDRDFNFFCTCNFPSIFLFFIFHAEQKNRRLKCGRFQSTTIIIATKQFEMENKSLKEIKKRNRMDIGRIETHLVSKTTH